MKSAQKQHHNEECTQKQQHNDERPKAIASDECVEKTTPGGASLHVATKSMNTHSKKQKSKKKKHTQLWPNKLPPRINDKP